MSPRPNPSTRPRQEAARAAQLAPFSWVIPRGVPEPVVGRGQLSAAQECFRHHLAHTLRQSDRRSTPVNALANALSVGGLATRCHEDSKPLIESHADHGITFHNPEAIALTLADRHQGIGPTTQEKLNRLMLCLTATPVIDLEDE